MGNKYRGVIAVKRSIAQLGLPRSCIENEGALRTRDDPLNRVIVQSHLEGDLGNLAEWRLGP
jgi:hypothetical protein